MPEPLARIALPHGARLDLWPTNVTTVLPDGREVPAAPNGDDDMLDTLAHELAHSLCADVLTASPSLCLTAQADGDGRRWTDERLAEETVALRWGRVLREAMEAARAYGVASP